MTLVSVIDTMRTMTRGLKRVGCCGRSVDGIVVGWGCWCVSVVFVRVGR